MTMLDFSKASEWKIVETGFDPSALGKAEANFCLGNGYLGLRSAPEERYVGETRDLLVAGTFDRFSPEEVTELPNAADVTNIELTLDGERFDLTQGEILSYSRELNIKTGLLTRHVRWRSGAGREYELDFRRVVSLKRLHSIAAKITIIPAQDSAVTVRSGIDGRVTCDGSQHFTEGQTRFYDKKIMQFVPRTIESGITFVVDATHNFYIDGAEVWPSGDINIVRRRMYSDFTLEAGVGETLVIEKYANVYTARDKDAAGLSVGELQAHALEELKKVAETGFDGLAAESAEEWRKRVWDRVPITIDGPDFDQLVIRFAQYHLQLMVPAHDNRMNIGAKSLTGEGYKGHVFWDTVNCTSTTWSAQMNTKSMWTTTPLQTIWRSGRSGKPLNTPTYCVRRSRSFMTLWMQSLVSAKAFPIGRRRRRRSTSPSRMRIMCCPRIPPT